MRVSKEKWDKLKKRGKGVARGAVSGTKSTAFEAAAGAGCKYAADLAKKHSSFVAEKAWAEPLALIVGGHMLKRSRKTASFGSAVVGAGGYALAIFLKNRKAAKTETKAEAVVTPAPPAAETQGWGDTGRVVRFPSPQDTGMVFRSAAREVSV